MHYVIQRTWNGPWWYRFFSIFDAMEFSARQIADVLEGEIIGDPKAMVDHFAKIEEGDQRALSFLANPKYTPHIYETGASIVIVNKSFVAEKELKPTLILVDDAYQSFTKLLAFANEFKTKKLGVEQPSFIDPTAEIGENVYIGAFAYVGQNVHIGKGVKIFPNTFIGDNVKIGEGTLIYAGTRIYADCEVGAFCTLHSGVIIGGDGFGFAPNGQATYDKVFHLGNVVIEDHVEIGANSTIDRATIGSTLIKKGVKLDNLIQIAHNVVVGENTVIAAQTGVAGSTKIGKNCMIGGQVGIVGHITIGDNVKIAAQSGIGSNVKDNEVLQGSPAFHISDYKRAYIYFRKLTELVERLETLEAKEKNKEA